MTFQESMKKLSGRAALVLTSAVFAFGGGIVQNASATAPGATAQDAGQEKKKEKPKVDVAALKQRMKSRYKTLAKLRDAGKVGETWGGFVDVVTKSVGSEWIDPKDKKKGTVATFLAAEVADRRALYSYLAVGLKTSPDKVGVQNGLRNLNRASAEHWFKLKSGKWAQRKSIRRQKKKTPQK